MRRPHFRGIEPGGVPYEHDSDVLATFVDECINKPHGQADLALRRYLSLFEALGAAVNEGVFDLAVMQRIDGPRIKALSEGLVPYIEHRARETGNRDIYGEFMRFAEQLRH